MVLGEDGMKGERQRARAWFRELDRLLRRRLDGGVNRCGRGASGSRRGGCRRAS